MNDDNRGMHVQNAPEKNPMEILNEAYDIVAEKYPTLANIVAKVKKVGRPSTWIGDSGSDEGSQND